MTGFVYAVECGQRIKIGFSKQPESRFNKIAVDAPFPCQLLGYWVGDKARELDIHDKFHELRVHGEWFAVTEHLLQFIADCTSNSVRTYGKVRCLNDLEQNALSELNRNKTLNLATLADKLGVNKSTVSRWANNRVPAEWVNRVEALTGISRHDLRPDIFGPAPSQEKVA